MTPKTFRPRPVRDELAARRGGKAAGYGTAIGDLKGSVGVSILGISGNVYHVHHHWVRDSGDTIFLNDAYLTTYPTSDTLGGSFFRTAMTALVSRR